MKENKDLILKTNGFIECSAVSKDNRFLAAAEEKMLYIVDLNSNQLICNKLIEDGIQAIENLYFDKTGRLFIDHRSHFSIWDRSGFFEPEFQYDDYRGFCFQDSKETGELLLSHPVKNRLFLTNKQLTDCTEAAELHYATDFADIEARFVLDDHLLVHTESWFTMKKHIKGEKVNFFEFKDWEKAVVLKVYKDQAVVFCNDKIRIIDLSNPPNFKQIHEMKIPVKNKNNIWMDPLMNFLCYDHNDKLTVKDLKTGETVNEYEIENTFQVYFVFRKSIHVGYDEIVWLI